MASPESNDILSAAPMGTEKPKSVLLNAAVSSEEEAPDCENQLSTGHQQSTQYDKNIHPLTIMSTEDPNEIPSNAVVSSEEIPTASDSQLSTETQQLTQNYKEVHPLTIMSTVEPNSLSSNAAVSSEEPPASENQLSTESPRPQPDQQVPSEDTPNQPSTEVPQPDDTQKAPWYVSENLEDELDFDPLFELEDETLGEDIPPPQAPPEYEEEEVYSGQQQPSLQMQPNTNNPDGHTSNEGGLKKFFKSLSPARWAHATSSMRKIPFGQAGAIYGGPEDRQRAPVLPSKRYFVNDFQDLSVAGPVSAPPAPSTSSVDRKMPLMVDRGERVAQLPPNPRLRKKQKTESGANALINQDNASTSQAQQSTYPRLKWKQPNTPSLQKQLSEMRNKVRKHNTDLGAKTPTQHVNSFTSQVPFVADSPPAGKEFPWNVPGLDKDTRWGIYFRMFEESLQMIT